MGNVALAFGQTPPGHLKPREVAALLQVGPTTVQRWASEGRLSFIRTSGGHRRYPEDKIRELLASPSENETWYERSTCRDMDRDLFYPEDGPSLRQAKQICQTCTVQTECLEYALENDERFGVWGGLSEQERRPQAAPRQARRQRRGFSLRGRPGSGTDPRWRADLTHCKHGHPFDDTNTRIDPKTGHRICRTCQANAKARFRSRAA